MKKNMGNSDRAIRLIVVAVIATLFFTGVLQGAIGTVLMVLAVILLLTSLAGFCPIYAPFGLRTRKGKPA